MKLPVVNTNEFIIYLELVNNSLVFIHCDVFKWSKKVKQDLLDKWGQLCLLHDRPIYAYHYLGDNKHLKFLKMTGFKLVKEGFSSDLRQIQIYVKGDSTWESQQH